MRNVYSFILKASCRVLTGLITLLGFSGTSCVGADEYGTPYAEFEVKGKVTDQAGKAIPGIHLEYGIVTNRTPDYRERFFVAATSATHEDGEYQITFQDSPEHKLRIIATDVDGPENGAYRTDSIDVEVGRFEGGKGAWYSGKISIEVPNIQLEEIQKQKE